MPNTLTATVEIALPHDELAEARAKLDIWPLWDQFIEAIAAKGFAVEGIPLRTKTNQTPTKRPPLTPSGKRMGRPPKVVTTNPAPTTPTNGTNPSAATTAQPRPLPTPVPPEAAD